MLKSIRTLYQKSFPFLKTWWKSQISVLLPKQLQRILLRFLQHVAQKRLLRSFTFLLPFTQNLWTICISLVVAWVDPTLVSPRVWILILCICKEILPPHLYMWNSTPWILTPGVTCSWVCLLRKHNSISPIRFGKTPSLLCGYITPMNCRSSSSFVWLMILPERIWTGMVQMVPISKEQNLVNGHRFSSLCVSSVPQTFWLQVSIQEICFPWSSVMTDITLNLHTLSISIWTILMLWMQVCIRKSILNMFFPMKPWSRAGRICPRISAGRVFTVSTIMKTFRVKGLPVPWRHSSITIKHWP